MSQLLQGQDKVPIPVTDSVLAPARFYNGLPYDGSGALAIDTVSAIDHYHQGLPYTAAGRLATAELQATTRIGNGAAPFTALGRLSMATALVTYFAFGVGYTAAQQIAVAA